MAKRHAREKQKVVRFSACKALPKEIQFYSFIQVAVQILILK